MQFFKRPPFFSKKLPQSLLLIVICVFLPLGFAFGAEDTDPHANQPAEVPSIIQTVSQPAKNAASVPIIVPVASRPASVSTHSPATTSCQCENISCEVCEREDGAEFYAAKCGVDDAKVKSCQRPKCVPVENQSQCLALFKKPVPSAVSDVAPKTALPQDVAPAPKTTMLPIVSGQVAGQITNLSGAVHLYRVAGGVEVAHENSKVYVGDRFETLSEARVRVLLRDQSEVTLAPQSVLKFTKVEIDASGENRRVVLDLEHGKVRNHVFKILASGSSYQVRTGNSIASVHGTDFMTAFEVEPTAWTTRIDTFDGVVRLERVISPSHQEPIAGQFVDLAAGNSGTFRAPSRAGDEEEDEYAQDLFKSPLPVATKLNAKEMVARMTDVSFVVDRADPKPAQAPRQPASVKTPELICNAPDGAFNQCSFTCKGNPKSEKTCRTDLKGVTCVRRICNANGIWADETRLPATKKPAVMPDCVPQKAVVRECGGYW